MEGNQSLQPHNRLLLVASVFAVIAILVFIVVLKWPALFGIEVAEEEPQQQMSAEEKMNVLAQLRSTEPEAFGMSAAQKAEALENVSAGTPALSGDAPPELTEEQKMDVLGSLNASE